MKKVIKYTLKTLKWLVIGVAGLLAIVLALLYIPPVQDMVVGKVLKSINDKGEMHLAVKKLRLSFPLKLRIDSVSMTSPGMEIAADKAAADISLMPLLGCR